MKMTKYLYLIQFQMEPDSWYNKHGIRGHLYYATSDEEAEQRAKALAQTTEVGRTYLKSERLVSGFRTGVLSRLPDGTYDECYYSGSITVEAESGGAGG